MPFPEPSTHTPAGVTSARNALLDALRVDLGNRLDEIVAAPGERASALLKEFAAVWKEFNAEVAEKLH